MRRLQRVGHRQRRLLGKHPLLERRDPAKHRQGQEVPEVVVSTSNFSPCQLQTLFCREQLILMAHSNRSIYINLPLHRRHEKSPTVEMP